MNDDANQDNKLGEFTAATDSAEESLTANVAQPQPKPAPTTDSQNTANNLPAASLDGTADSPLTSPQADNSNSATPVPADVPKPAKSALKWLVIGVAIVIILVAIVLLVS